MRSIEQILKDYGSEDLEALMIECSLSFPLFAEVVIGLELADYHLEWFDLIRKYNRVNIIAPRGHGKTEFFGVAYPLWVSLFNKGKQCMIISKSLDQSTAIIQRIKDRMNENELLKHLIPEKTMDTTWRRTELVTTTNCRILCKPYT